MAAHRTRLCRIMLIRWINSGTSASKKPHVSAWWTNCMEARSVVSGEWLLLIFLLLNSAEVAHVSVDPSNKCICVGTQFADKCLVAIALVDADVQIVDDFIHRTSGDSTESQVLQIMPS